jgi:hypothetical protein
MNKILAAADVGKKNVVFGIVLFLILGVVVGIPLTIDFLGGSILASDQYLTWKVVHGYGVFLAFINYFLGLTIDRWAMPKQHKEFVSWSFLMAGLIGGVGRMILVLTSSLNAWGLYASLAETVCFILGTFVFVRGQLRARPSDLLERSAQARSPRAG